MMQSLIDIAIEAGQETLNYYNSDVEVDFKSDDSPVTQADLASNKVIVDGLGKFYRDIPLISEESNIPEYGIRKDWDQYFLVDPLDGTKEFIKNNNEFTVNIALIEKGIPVMGVVYAPALNLLYYGAKELGSYRSEKGGEPKRIFSEPANKSKSLIVAESRSHRSQKLEDYYKVQGIKVKETVKAGSSLKLCLVADGTVDIYPRMGPTMEWDVAAGDAVFRYSSKDGQHSSELKYNKENLLNPSFVIGF